MNMQIRRAAIEELELLVRWRREVLREVFALSDEAALDKLEDENRRYYREAIPCGEHIACFALCGGEIIGCGGVCFSWEMPSPDNPSGRCAYLMNIYTRPAYRGQGAGRAAVEWMIAQAHQNGAGKIYLEATPSGRILYEKLGFRDMEGYMIQKLG